MKNILLMGPPGVGKTTIVVQALSQLGEEAGGFYTREIREGGGRQGFQIISLDGREGILAHKDIKGPYRVSKYKVNIKDLEEIGVRAIEEAILERKYIIIDEIGKMELYSPKFRDAVLRALDSDKQVLATIKEKGNGFVASIKERQDIILLEVTLKNREALVQKLLGLLKSSS